MTEINENTALQPLAAALEQAKWKLPPALGELTAFLSRMMTDLRRAAQGVPFDENEKTAVLRRCAERLNATGENRLDASPEGRAALDAAVAAAELACTTAPLHAEWLTALLEVLRIMQRICAAEVPVHSVTSAQAEAICDAVLARARAMGLRLVAAVCDDGGNLLAMRRDDQAFIASIDIAVNKAYTAVALKMPTKALAQLAAPGGPLYGIQHTNQGRIVIFGGGVPIERGGAVIGGFGVSGGTAEQDTEMGDFAAALAARLCAREN